MHSMMLGVKSEMLNLVFPIKSRMTILRGDSGACKTFMVNLLQRSDPGIEVIKPLQVIQVTGETLSALAPTTTNSILLIDDELYSKRDEADDLSLLYNRYAIVNNQYYIVIDRGVTAFYSMSYDVKSILTVKQVSVNEYEAVQTFQYLNDESGLSKKIVTEDSKAGYEFARCFLNKVKSGTADGKGNFTTDTVDMTDATALLDVSAFGCHIDEFAMKSEKDHRKLFYNVDSFEKMLIDLMKGTYSIDTFQYKSKELAFECLMNQIPDTERLKTPHGSRLTLCLRADCNSCPHSIYQNCQAEYTDFNLEVLMRKAGYSDLLLYHNSDHIHTLNYPETYSLEYLLCALYNKQGWYSIERFASAKKRVIELLSDRKSVYIRYNGVSRFLLVNHPKFGLLVRLVQYNNVCYKILGFEDKGVLEVSL